MVKASKTGKPKTIGSKRPVGQPPKGDAARSDRLIMRIHPDVLPLLDQKAVEQGLTRSQFVEKLLVGWLRLDPRTPRIDAVGRLEVSPAPSRPGAPVRSGSLPRPAEPSLSPHIFLSRWEKFCTAARLVMGWDPKDELIEYYVDRHGPEPDQDADRSAVERWLKRPR